MKNKTQKIKEIIIEKKLRKYPLLIPFATLITAAILLLTVGYCMSLFSKGVYWVLIPSSLCAHAFLIITVHDGTHKAITKTKYDRLIINICSALFFLPVYGEHYRKYHLLHHRDLNTELDPIASQVTKELYKKNRFLYVLLESIPLLYTIYILFNYNKQESTPTKKSLRINKKYFILSISTSVVWYFLIQPPLYFVLFTLLLLNILSVVRNWCEHMGTSSEHESNTYWFPMGFGIGNHDVHHRHPTLSWLTLSIGLMYRKKNSNPIKALKGVLFDSRFNFYKSK